MQLWCLSSVARAASMQLALKVVGALSDRGAARYTMVSNERRRISSDSLKNSNKVSPVACFAISNHFIYGVMVSFQ
jgi:hypothetical protein